MTPSFKFLLALQAARRLQKAIRIGPRVPNRRKGIKAYLSRKPPTREQALALKLHQVRRASRYLRSPTKSRTPPSHIQDKILVLNALKGRTVSEQK